MKKCTIMQPAFLPWIGYFDLVDQVDLFVFYDDVQLSKRSWQTRNRIKTNIGEKFLTIPIKKTKTRSELLIMDAEISYDQNWDSKMLKMIDSVYRKSEFYDEVYEFILKYFKKKYKYISDLNKALIIDISKKIGIKAQFINSSDLKNITGSKDSRLVSICNNLSLKSYISPKGSATYIELISPGGHFSKNNISLFYHAYNHPNYNQLHDKFVPYMSILDLLFNCGFDNSLRIIKKGRKTNIDFKTYRTKYLNYSE